jgi:hypothetical protein
LEEELGDTRVALGQPTLDGHHLHQVVSESDREHGHRRDVEHGVQVAERTHDWNVNEVLVEEVFNLAGVLVC